MDLSNRREQHHLSGALGLIGGEHIERVPIDLLVPYENQPFKPYTEEALKELAEDIQENGLLSPIVVNKRNDGKLLILSGHNRAEAVKRNGDKIINAIVKNVDEATAMLILTNANLNQRQELLPSEKAFAYKMRYESQKRQGKRTDLKNEETNTDELKLKDNERQIQRFIRLTELTEELLQLVDEKVMPMNAGVDLSYIEKSEQETLLDFLKETGHKITLDKSAEIKKEKGNITVSKLEEIFDDEPKSKAKTEKLKKAKGVTIKVDSDILVETKEIKNMMKDTEKMIELSLMIKTFFDKYSNDKEQVNVNDFENKEIEQSKF